MVSSFRFPGVPFKECNVLLMQRLRIGNAEHQRIIYRPFQIDYDLSDPSKIRSINSFDGLQTTTRIISHLYLFTSDNRQDTGGSSASISTLIGGASVTTDIVMDEVVYFRYLIRYPTWDSNLGPRAP